MEHISYRLIHKGVEVKASTNINILRKFLPAYPGSYIQYSKGAMALYSKEKAQ